MQESDSEKETMSAKIMGFTRLNLAAKLQHTAKCTLIKYLMVAIGYCLLIYVMKYE